MAEISQDQIAGIIETGARRSLDHLCDSLAKGDTWYYDQQQFLRDLANAIAEAIDRAVPE